MTAALRPRPNEYIPTPDEMEAIKLLIRQERVFHKTTSSRFDYIPKIYKTPPRRR